MKYTEDSQPGQVILPREPSLLSREQRALWSVYDHVTTLLTREYPHKPVRAKAVQQLVDEVMVLVLYHTIRLGRWRFPRHLGSLRTMRTGPRGVAVQFVMGDATRAALGRPMRRSNRATTTRTLARLDAAYNTQAQALVRRLIDPVTALLNDAKTFHPNTNPHEVLAP